MQPALQMQTQPTMVFIGVTTAGSSIMRIFPKWSEILGIGAHIIGCDAPLRAPGAVYRAIVEHIQRDPLMFGALVTTHKIDLLAAARDLFGYLDPYAELCGEISSISKRGGALAGHAKDPISSGLAWRAFVPAGYWEQHPHAEVLCLGAGGAALAISVAISEMDDRPRRFTAVDKNAERLAALKAVHQRIHTDIQFEYVLNADAAQNDVMLARMPAGSLVINATGMGKDLPGSPITDLAVFPEGGLVWELNYRGDLGFLKQAHRQQQARGLAVEDGWVYFLHGWTQVIAEVFHLTLTAEHFAALAAAADDLRG